MKDGSPVPTFLNGSLPTLLLFGESHIVINHNKRTCSLSDLTLLMLVNITKANDERHLDGKPLEVIVYEYGLENSS